MEKLGANCFICGNDFCEEDSDHEHITPAEFESFLKERAGYQPEIAHLKFKIKSAFQKLEKKSNYSLVAFQTELLLLVDKLHFWDLLRFESSLKDIEAAIFGFMLPKSQIIRLIALLKKSPDASLAFPGHQRLLQQIHNFKKNYRSIIQNHQYNELIEKFRKIITEHELESQQREYTKFEKRRKATSDYHVAAEVEGDDVVLIEGIPFSTRRNSLDLSILEVTDKQLITYLQGLQKIKNLKELHLRNSCLSQKAYQMLFNSFPHLETLDLSNSQSENYSDFIGKYLPKLKTLYLNQTQLSDRNLKKILSNLPNLRAIFLNQNQISGEGLRWMASNKSHLLYVSLRKNKNIDLREAEDIMDLLSSKGGFLEF